MRIEKLIEPSNLEFNRKLSIAFTKMQNLIEAFNKKEIPQDLIAKINDDIQKINSFSGSHRELTKIIRKSYSKALKIVEEKMKYVAKFHYRNLWIAYGLLAGVVFTPLFERLEFMGIGSSIGLAIPIGMIIGMVIGNNMDQQAEKEGNQLDLATD